MAAAAVAAPLVAGGLSVFGGLKKRQSLREQALGAEYEARSFELRAQQVAADRRHELRQTLSAIKALRATSGAGLDSPTAQAIERGTKAASARAEDREVLGERQSAFSKRREASGLRKAGTAALISGVAQGVSSASRSSIFRPGG